ncbi:hypothetical protein HFN89_01675 [Rhizobium laguerreae]|nr:hypothetical protein [Rhizobium laguerreae]
MPYSAKVVRNSKTLVLTVQQGANVLVHDSAGDPSALSVIFPTCAEGIAEILVAAGSSDDLAALVRQHAPDTWAFAVVPGRITLLLRMADSSETFLHRDIDGSLSAHGSDFSKVEPESLFWGGLDDAMKQLAAADTPVAMFDVLQNVARSNIVSVSAPKPFPDRASPKAIETALDLMEGMLKPGFDPKEARAFLLSKGRSVPIVAV